MKWTCVTRADLNTAIAAIKFGHDPVAARNLIEYFHERMSNGDFYDKDMLHLLMAHVFSEMVERQVPPEQAFGLKRKRGMRPREDTEARDLAATACVLMLMRKGETWESAVFDTARLLFPDGSRGDRTVARAYSAYHLTLDGFHDETLTQLLAPLTVPS